MTWIYQPPEGDREHRYLPEPDLIPPCPKCGDRDRVQLVVAEPTAVPAVDDELDRILLTDAIVKPGDLPQPWWCPACSYAYPWAYPFERTLVVREPWVSLLVDGYKIWELRRRSTKVRGPIGLTPAKSGEIAGTAELVDVHGPFDAEDLGAHRNKHLVDHASLDAYAAGKRLFAWEFRKARRFSSPVPYRHPKGGVGWVKLRHIRTGAADWWWRLMFDRDPRPQPLEEGWTGVPSGARTPLGYALSATLGWCTAAHDLDPPFERVVLCEDLPNHAGPHYSNQAGFVRGWPSYVEWIDSDEGAFRLDKETSPDSLSVTVEKTGLRQRSIKKEVGQRVRRCDECNGYGVEPDITIHELDPCPRCSGMPALILGELDAEPAPPNPDPNTAMRWCFAHLEIVGEAGEDPDCVVGWVARPTPP